MRFPRTLLILVAVACGGGDGGTGPTPPPAPVPAAVSVATQPSATVQNGVALNTQPVVRLRDAQGVPAPAAGVVVTATLAGGAGVVLANATATTNSSGVASFSGLTLTGTAGSYTLRFSAPNLTPADANPITVTPGAPTQLALITQPAAAAQAGVALATQPAVQLRDQSGNDVPVAGTAVTASLVGGTMTLANATAQTNASGLATFSGLSLSGTAGSYTLRFTSGTLAAATAAAPTVVSAGAATQLALTTAPSPSATNGAVLAVPPVVQLRDAFGNDAAQTGVRITASIVSGPAGAALAGDTSSTDATGRAVFGALAITGTAGSYSLRFAATGFTSIVSVTPVLLGAGAAAKLGIVTPPPASAQSGVAMTAVPVVQVQDQSGNAVAQAGTVVTASLASGSATIGNAAATTDATGKATFTGLTLSGAASAYLLQFSATGLTAVIAGNGTTLLAGPAAALTLTTPPSTSATNAVALAAQPVVQLRDGQGNPVATAGMVITAALVSGSAVLDNATATTNASGVATFAGLSITGPVGSYTLRFSSGSAGVGTVDAPATTLVAGAPRRLSLAVEPATSAVSGSALAPQPSVQLRDTTGNVVAQAGVVVTASLVSGSATVAGATATSNTSGVAVFSALSLSGPPGSYALRFTSGSLVGVTAAAATALSAGAPAQLVIVTPPPTTAVNGAVFGTAPVVEVQDATGNPLAGETVCVATSGNVAVTNAVAVTGANGRASFASLTLTGQLAGYSLFFGHGANCLTTSIVVGSPTPTSLVAGPPAAVSVTTAPSASAQSGVALGQQPVARVTDVSGNPLSGVSVTVTIGAGASVAGGSATTSSSGSATFSGLTVSGSPGSYTLSFTAGSATTGAPLALMVGAPASVSINVQPPASAQSGAEFTTAPVVTVRDATGNPIGGLAVDASAGGATTINGSAVTNGAGAATFTAMGLAGAAPASYTITFTAGGAQATSNAVSLTPGNASGINVVTAPSATAQNGVALATQPVIHLEDGSGNPLSNRLITASVIGGSVQVSNAVAVTDNAGNAAFSGLALTGAAGSYTLRFTSQSSLSIDVPGVTLTTGVATRLMVQAGSTSATNGAALTTQPVIRVADAGGNPVSQAATVTASVASGAVALANASASTGGGATAAFSGLTLTGTAGTHVVTFSAPGLSATTLSVALGAGAATGLSLVTQPAGSTTLGQPLPVQPVVRLVDMSGNTVSQAGLSVVAGSVSGTATLSGTTSVLTSASGIAAFSNLGLSAPQGRSVLRFTSGSLAAVTATDTTVAAAALALDNPSAQTGGVNTQNPFAVTVPAGVDSLVVTISGSGGADLLLRYGAVPDIDGLWDCRPGLGGSNERCTMLQPAAGTWYILLYAIFSYSNVTLTARVF